MLRFIAAAKPWPHRTQTQVAAAAAAAATAAVAALRFASAVPAHPAQRAVFSSLTQQQQQQQQHARSRWMHARHPAALSPLCVPAAAAHRAPFARSPSHGQRLFSSSSGSDNGGAAPPSDGGSSKPKSPSDPNLTANGHADEMDAPVDDDDDMEEVSAEDFAELTDGDADLEPAERAVLDAELEGLLTALHDTEEDVDAADANESTEEAELRAELRRVQQRRKKDALLAAAAPPENHSSDDAAPPAAPPSSSDSSSKNGNSPSDASAPAAVAADTPSAAATSVESLSESDVQDWGASEFRPDRSMQDGWAAPRPREVFTIGILSKFIQLPGQIFNVPVPASLFQHFYAQHMANQMIANSVAPSSGGGGEALIKQGKRMFLGIFFLREDRYEQVKREARVAAAEKLVSKIKKRLDITDKKMDAADKAEPAARDTTATAASSEAPASAAVDAPAAAAASASAAHALDVPNLHSPGFSPVAASHFEPQGLFVEVLELRDSNWLVVKCLRRISIAEDAKPQQPFRKLSVIHHDNPSWAQIKPPTLRYDAELLKVKNECLRLLRAIRELEGGRPRVRPFFAFNENVPGSLVDYWATLASPAPFEVHVVAGDDRRHVELQRSVLSASALLPRLQSVRELLHRELQSVQKSKLIEADTQRRLKDRHAQMLQQQKTNIDKAMQQANRDQQQQQQQQNASASGSSGGASTAGTTTDGRTEKERLLDKFASRISALVGVPDDARQVMDDELAKLTSMDSESSFEYGSTRNYLDWLTQLPWGKTLPERFDIRHAERVLDADHYGLDEVKTRILEFIASGKMLGKVPQGKIICLLGPPGVGKTSIGKSIASALDRKFFRFSVGGMEDVAEIKGHRRTYVSSMPGKLVQALKRVECANPVILIDEIDKLGRSARGDPASALLEVLDPEQNSAFSDHYLDVPVDLSKVLFVCTANDRSTIPGPLADRMDFIELSGYLASEKVRIAQKYLEPAIRTGTGVSASQLVIQEDALFHLIRWYCREAGVRSLQKYLEKIYRKVALVLARKNKKPIVTTAVGEAEAAATAAASAPSVAPSSADSAAAPEPSAPAVSVSASLPPFPSSGPLVITPSNLSLYAGAPNYLTDKLYEVNPVGVSTGLAYSSNGGAVLFIESAIADADVSSTAEQLRAAMGGQQQPDDSGDARPDEAEDPSADADEEDDHSRANPAHMSSPSRGDLFCTGQLGSVMRESSSIAYTVAKRILFQRTAPNSPHRSFFSQHRIHLHLPHGSTPKDGPSAGIAMVTSLLSLALQTPPLAAHAMTGEITLTGKVLPIGGVKDKLMAAKHASIKLVVLPADNRKDVAELQSFITEGMDIQYASTYDDVFKLIFPHWTDSNTASSSSLQLPLPLLSPHAGLPAAL